MLAGKKSVILMLGAAAVAGLGLAAHTFAADSVTTGFAVPYGPVGDDSPQENQVTYTSFIVQNTQTPAEGTIPNGQPQGAGDPYIIATMGYHYATSGFSGGSITTAFDTNGSGINYFGQNSNASSAQYVNDAYINTYQTTAPLNFHSANLAGENAAGQVIGYQSRETADDTSSSTGGTFGRNSYLYNIPSNTYVNMGLTGSGYYVNINYTSTSGAAVAPYSSSTATNIDQLGDVVGTSNRYFTGDGTASTSSAAGMGQSVFYYNGSTTTEIGLVGTNYSYTKTFTGSGGGTGRYSNNNQNGVNGGYADGTATLYVDNGNSSGTSYGTDAWVYSPSSGTTAIGLYQAGSSPAGLTGVAYSYPTTINSTVYNDRSTSLDALNAVGQVGGLSNYYAGTSTIVGTDAFIYTPGTTPTYVQVGLLGTGYVSTTGARSSTISFLNNNGYSTGTSKQYIGTGTSSTNTIAWLATPAGTTTPIGLTGTGPTGGTYTVPTTGSGYFPTSISEMTTGTNLVAGTSNEYTGTTVSGVDAWEYNISSGVYTTLEPTPSSLANYSGYFSDKITYLAENGDAVGSFQLASGGPSYAFFWSPLGGFDDLNNDPAIAAELGNTPFNVLLSAYSVDPTGTTLYVNAGTENFLSGSQTTTGVAIVTVPEPASVGLVVGLGAVATLRRRRRAAAC